MRSAVRRQVLRLAVACACAAALTAASYLIAGPRGLRAQYYLDVDAAGAPAFSALDDDLSTARLISRWGYARPDRFSVRWFGYIGVPESGDYTFFLTSDDAGALVVDDKRVIDMPGVHGPLTGVARLSLTAGPHRIRVEYGQFGEALLLDLTWARGTDALAPVPAWMLTPRRVSIQGLRTAHALDRVALVAWILSGVLALALLVTAWTEVTHGVAAGVARVPRLAALVFFLLLAIAHTWPMASDLAHLSRNDNGDTVLNEWIVSWVAHQLPRHPLQLFSANIFYPEAHSLAFSESLIVQGVMAMPLRWLGASPVLTYNLLLLAGFALTAWSMCVLIQRWTGSWTAALVSGALYGFNAHTLTRLPHLQAQHVEFFPFALLALDALLRRPTIGRGFTLAFWYVLQALTSIHLLVFCAFGLAAATLVSVEQWWGRQKTVRLLGPLLVAAAAAGLVLLPFLVPYQQVSAALHFRRPLDSVLANSATWRDYLSTPARVHFTSWSSRFFVSSALFPGALALVLAGFAVARGIAVRDLRARMCLALVVVGAWLSFGPRLPGYALLYDLIVPLQAIRAISRIGYLAIAGVAALAGFGAASLLRAAPARGRTVLGVVLIGIAAAEPTVAPIYVTRFDRIPAIYDRIPTSPQAVVVELPFFGLMSASLHAPYMLNSTVHWQPMLNGYSGFQPESFNAYTDDFRDFPGPRTMATLDRLNVTWVVVHRNLFQPDQLEALAHQRRLELVAEEGSIALYRRRG